MEKLERLQKILAAAGIASRRQAEELIRAGRVSVNGRTMAQLGAKADAVRDHIKIDGKLLGPPARKAYLLLNKPRGVICTVADTQGRVKVTDLVRVKGKVFPVGRLDYNTEGLILLTNDGEFARIVSAAGNAFPRVYQVKVRGVPDDSALKRLRCGLRLPDGIQLAPCKIRTLRRDRHAWLEVTLVQGINREIRRMFEAIGHPVTKLRRTRIGIFTEAGLPVGCSRRLTPEEISTVLRMGRSPAGRSLPDV